MKKKKISFLSRAAMTLFVMLLTTITAWAYGIPTSGSCGKNATYVITGNENDYTLTISGTGAIDRTFFDGIIVGNDYNRDLTGIKTIVINEGITSIGDNAFNDYYNRYYGRPIHEFTTVSIPSTVTTIGEFAFHDCRSLQTVNIAAGSQLTSIGRYAFNNTCLNQLLLPCPNLASIGSSAFNLYETGKTLSEVVCLTETALSVHNYVFYSCSNMATVYMLGDYKVNWPDAKATKSLVKEVVAGSGISSLSVDYSSAEKKTVCGVDYYVSGSNVELTLSSNLSGSVVYHANGRLLDVTNGTATLTLPDDASTITITAQQVQTLANGSGTESDPYQIGSLDDWNIFAGMVNAGHEADKYYKLTNDIGTDLEPVTTMVGSLYTPFKGFLLGGQHKLTVNISSTTDDCALFGCIEGAKIWMLTIQGTISTSKRYAAAIAARSKGICEIRSCENYVTIQSTATTSGDGTHGGFVALNESGAILTILESFFKGRLLGTNATSCGGFVGYNNGVGITFSDCLFAPEEVTMSDEGSATFCRNKSLIFTRCYYTQSFGTAQATHCFANISDIPSICTYTTVNAVSDNKDYYVSNGATISTAADWNTFAECVNNGMTFSGLDVTLNDNIPTSNEIINGTPAITTMVGTSTNKFMGTFKGNGHTMTVNLTGSDEFTAPFCYVDGATITRLHTVGTVTSAYKYATGLVGNTVGNVNINLCRSSVTIVSSVDGDGTHGGFVGVVSNNTTTINDCRFDGVICATAENSTYSCGGFVGWRSSTLSISNSLYAPAAIPDGKYSIYTDHSNDNSCTFTRNYSDNVSNSYYITALKTTQGTDASSMTASELLEGLGSNWTIINGEVVPKMWDVVLDDGGNNSSAIENAATNANNGSLSAILGGRTLYKDGAWNTLCLPFDVTIADSPLSGDNVVAKELNAGESSLDGEGKLTLKFTDAPATISAGTPFIIKWDNTGVNLVEPVFVGVTVSDNAAASVAFGDGNASFVGTYSPFDINSGNKGYILLLTSGGKLGYSKAERTLGSCRAYFEINSANAAREFVIDFGEETTGIQQVESGKLKVEGYYDLQGRKVAQPTKGLYIVNGKKAVIK